MKFNPENCNGMHPADVERVQRIHGEIATRNLRLIPPRVTEDGRAANDRDALVVAAAELEDTMAVMERVLTQRTAALQLITRTACVKLRGSCPHCIAAAALGTNGNGGSHG